VDAERDPSNTLARATLGTTLQFLANNARERDRLDEAAEYFARAETVAGEIRKLAPDHVDLLRTQAASAGKYHCLVQNERGAHDLALAACSRSLEALDHAYTIDPSHPARERDVLSVSTLAARAAVGAGKREESRAHAERATSLAQKIVDAGGNAGDRLALADALLARATLAHREGDRKVQRECTDRARSVLADLDPAPDPTKAASLRDELARLSPRTP
jgi:tetratricopeptide (TPR) repeat protein